MSKECDREAKYGEAMIRDGMEAPQRGKKQFKSFCRETKKV
jgi:hypothetical protein